MSDGEESTIEALELMFDKLMSGTDVEPLQKLMAHLGFEEKHWRERKQSYMMKALRREAESQETNDDKIAILNRMIARLMLEIERSVPPTAEDVIVKDVKDVDESKPATTAMTSRTLAEPRDVLSATTSILRKQFRITGSIGPDKLSYVTVCRQIREGRDNGFTEGEIISGVLNAVSDKLLRNYLEMLPDLSLTSLTEQLRIEYKEKTPTEYFQELINAKQQKGEDSNSFVIRALELRDKVIFTAQNEEGSIPYHREQVKRMFLSTLETGLTEEVAMKVRPYLLDPTVSDITLRNQINKAETSIKMRMMKDGTLKSNDKDAPKTAKVGGVSTEDKMTKLVQDLQKQMDSLQTKMQQMSTSAPRTRQRPICDRCKRDGATYCTHCMNCGQEGHTSRGCLERRQRSGNGQQLRQRDSS